MQAEGKLTPVIKKLKRKIALWKWRKNPKNIEHERLRAKEYNAKNRDRISAYQIKYYAENKSYVRDRNNRYIRTLRRIAIKTLGCKCFVFGCQSNKDAKSLRFIGLEPHHLNRNFDRYSYRKGYRMIIDGGDRDVHLLCGYHHAIADKLGKRKWLLWLRRKNGMTLKIAIKKLIGG